MKWSCYCDPAQYVVASLMSTPTAAETGWNVKVSVQLLTTLISVCSSNKVIVWLKMTWNIIALNHCLNDFLLYLQVQQVGQKKSNAGRDIAI